MQTFLPHPDLRASSVVLDDRRLGKQRVETLQILRALTWETYAWKNHPAVRMWRGFVPGLVRYGRENCREWMRRGYADSVADQLLEWTDGVEPDDPPLPPWFGWEPFHRSHRLALLRKDPAHYAEHFPVEAAYGGDDGYVWPADVFPTWPVRTQGEPLDLASGVRRLGLEAARHGQAAAVDAIGRGRDVLGIFRPGSGGSTTGLLCGLATKGRTVWVHPPLLPRAGAVPAVVGPPAREVAGGDAAPLTARAPGPADVLAMRAEAGPPEFLFLPADFRPADSLPATRPVVSPGEPTGLVVVDRADQLEAEQARAVVDLRRRLGDPPLLALAGRADAVARDVLASVYDLRDHAHVGGGWDPGSVLDLVHVPTTRARGAAVAELVAAERPALVVCPTRGAARRRAERLTAEGLRAEVWAPARTRPSAAALDAWRGRRLAALVVAIDALPPLGRGRLPLLVSEDPPSLESWRQEIEVARAERSVAVVSRGSFLDADAGCLRAQLLDHFGEPVDVPCGRCRPCVG